MLLDKTVHIPDLGDITPDSGFHVLESTEDGRFTAGKHGVCDILATGDKKVEFVSFGDSALACVKSAIAFPTYYPVLPVKTEYPVRAVLMDLDGTTVRSEEFWIWIIQMSVASLLGNPKFELDESDIPFVSGHSVSEHLQYCIDKYCPGASLDDARGYYFEHTHREMDEIMQGRGREGAFTPTVGVKDFLLELKAMGVKIGLVTSGLYEKAVSRWHLVDRPFAEGGIIPVDIPGTSRISSYDPDEWEGESMEFLSRVQSYDGLSDGVNKYLSLEWLNPSKLIASAKGRAAVYAREDESAYGRFEVYSYADRCGAYINTVRGWSEAHYSGWEGTVYYDEGFQEMACFKEGSDEPLKLEDLFWKGDLAKEYLRNAQMESFRRDSATFYKSNYNILVRLTQELTDHISGFNVQRNYLIVEYDTDISAIILKHFPKAGNNYRATLLSDTGYFDYSSIGYDNLRIFK